MSAFQRIECPFCGSRGLAVKIMKECNTYRCDACRHMWDVQAQGGDVPTHREIRRAFLAPNHPEERDQLVNIASMHAQAVADAIIAVCASSGKDPKPLLDTLETLVDNLPRVGIARAELAMREIIALDPHPAAKKLAEGIQAALIHLIKNVRMGERVPMEGEPGGRQHDN